MSPTISGQPHRNFAVKKFPGTGAVCAAIWRPKIYWNRAMAVPVFSRRLRPSAKVALERPSAPNGRAKPLRVDAELGPRGQADHVDPTRKLPLSARGVRQSQEIFGPQNCGAVGQTLSATGPGLRSRANLRSPARFTSSSGPVALKVELVVKSQ